MTFNRFLTSVLALAAAVVPVSASSIFCSSGCGAMDQTAFMNATTSVYFPNPPITISGGVFLQDWEYEQSAIDFFSFHSGGLAFDNFSIALKTLTPGDLIEVVLPSPVSALSAHIKQSDANASLCFGLQANFGACTPIFPNSTAAQFVGFVSDTPFTTFWIAPVSGSAMLQLNDIETFTQLAQTDTPEIATFLMIGIGLISLRFLPRRLRPAV